MAHKFIIPSIILVIFLIFEVALIAVNDFIDISLEDAHNTKTNIKERLSPVLANPNNKQVIVTWGDGQKSLLAMADFTVRYQRQYLRQESLRINFDKLEEALRVLAPAINQQPVNAKFEFAQQENRLREFSLPQDGQKLNIERSAAQIARGLSAGQTSIALIVDKVPPAISLKSVTQLGITTLLGRGESDFKGSSANRIHNIKTGSAKLHGVLLKPGEEFSFNSILGQVDGQNGYRHELVVKSGKFIPEYGGGLCQVSTTMFRAAIFAGLPIVERRGHSLPVKYYNPQGFDATIYPGVTDLKFTNDTPNNILIQNKIENTKLIFEIYGSNDGRKTEVVGPNILEQKPNGSMKTILTRKITLPSGETKEEFFKTSYKSPSLFHLEKNPLE